MENFKSEGKYSAIDNLQKRLESAGIDTSLWGVGRAKTLAHLQEELENGEVILIEGENGELIRQGVVVGADIYYKSHDGKKYYLREERQIFRDGRVRERKLEQSVSEKLKRGEDPENAMIRGLKEELGIDGEIHMQMIKTYEKVVNSSSYPGLLSRYTIHWFRVVLTDDQFNPEGYIEEQPDKTTYFVWKEIKENTS